MSSCVYADVSNTSNNEVKHTADASSSRQHDENDPNHHISPVQPPSLARPMPPPSDQKVSSTEDVGAVVAKAKRAASSLWMILHAQGCRMGTKGCRLKGCSEAKFILLHLKTCPAGPSFDCPKGFRGCNQTRKLLAHYERCRDIRNRQNCQIMKNGRKNPLAPQQHACLVCSFLARHARNHVLECRKKTSTDRRSGGSGCKAKKVIISSFTLPDTNNKNTSLDKDTPLASPPKSNHDMMPPPPCRPPSTKTRSISGKSSIPCSSADLTKIKNHAVVLSLPLPRSNESLLGKSLDSSASRSSRNHQQSFIDKVSELQDVFKEGGQIEEGADCLSKSYGSIGSLDDRPTSFVHQRRRSESCNDAVTSSPLQSSNQRSLLGHSQSLPRNFYNDPSSPNDPTLEFSLVAMKENGGNSEGVVGEEIQKPQNIPRRRSSSCSILENLVRHPGGFDTIAEEQEGNVVQTTDNDTLFSVDM